MISGTGMTLLAAIGAGLIVLVLLRAIVHKLSDIASFSAIVAEYRLLPGSFAMTASVALVAMEILAVLLLISPVTHVAGASLAALLFSIYGVAMAINVQRGRLQIDCGCGGPGQAVSAQLVVRNAVLCAIAIGVALAGAPRGLVLSDGLIVFGGVLLSWLLFVIYDRILGIQAHAALTGYSRTGGE